MGLSLPRDATRCTTRYRGARGPLHQPEARGTAAPHWRRGSRAAMARMGDAFCAFQSPGVNEAVASSWAQNVGRSPGDVSPKMLAGVSAAALRSGRRAGPQARCHAPALCSCWGRAGRERGGARRASPGGTSGRRREQARARGARGAVAAVRARRRGWRACACAARRRGAAAVQQQRQQRRARAGVAPLRARQSASARVRARPCRPPLRPAFAAAPPASRPAPRHERHVSRTRSVACASCVVPADPRTRACRPARASPQTRRGQSPAGATRSGRARRSAGREARAWAHTARTGRTGPPAAVRPPHTGAHHGARARFTRRVRGRPAHSQTASASSLQLAGRPHIQATPCAAQGPRPRHAVAGAPHARPAGLYMPQQQQCATSAGGRGAHAAARAAGGQELHRACGGGSGALHGVGNQQRPA